jgi:hypothetical protein
MEAFLRDDRPDFPVEINRCSDDRGSDEGKLKEEACKTHDEGTESETTENYSLDAWSILLGTLPHFYRSRSLIGGNGERPPAKLGGSSVMDRPGVKS